MWQCGWTETADWAGTVGHNETRAYVDRTPTHNTHLCFTVCSQARNVHHALGSSHTDCSVIFVRLKRICHLVLHMPHHLLFSHPPFTTSTSSSSFTLPYTTTQEHEAQPVQQEPLREHPVRHAHRHASSVDKAAPSRISGVKSGGCAEIATQLVRDTGCTRPLETFKNKLIRSSNKS